MKRFLIVAASFCLAVPLAAQEQSSPCHTSGPFPVANRMSASDRNTFIDNLPAKLITEPRKTRDKAEYLLDETTTCLRVYGRVLRQNFWNPGTMYITDGTRNYMINMVDGDTHTYAKRFFPFIAAAGCHTGVDVVVVGEFGGYGRMVQANIRHYLPQMDGPPLVMMEGEESVYIENAEILQLSKGNGNIKLLPYKGRTNEWITALRNEPQDIEGCFSKIEEFQKQVDALRN